MPTVVLIHGLFGFGRILWLEYFNGVRPLYEAMGLRVVVPVLPWAGNIDERSQKLAEQLANEPGPLHLVAHSMGGIDARAYISRLGGAHKVATLTTLATPHLGSPAADHVCNSFSPFRIFAGVRSLTREQLIGFNSTTLDIPNVVYRSYAARRPVNEHPWIVRRYGRIIEHQEGPNDSQVSVDSASWGESVGILQADHFELIGRNFWFNPFKARERFDHLQLYREIGEWILRQASADNQSR